MTVHDLFNAIFNASLVVMIITLVASLGLGFHLSQLLEPLKRVWLLLGTIVVNLALAPLIAIGVCHLLPLSSANRTGVVLAVIAAGGPGSLKAAAFAKRADMALAVSFCTVLLVLDMAAAPIWAKAIISGATVKPASIFVDLLLLVVIPLTVGMVLFARHAEHAPGWKSELERISNYAFYVVLGVGLAANWKLVVHSIGSWTILASILIVAIFLVLGWAVGIRDQQSAISISMITGFRFIPVGLIIIATVLQNQGQYLAPALVFGLFDTFIPMFVGVEIGRRVSRSKTEAPVAKPALSAAAGGAQVGHT
jgi:BASS family bile acid:Na+ symporter